VGWQNHTYTDTRMSNQRVVHAHVNFLLPSVSMGITLFHCREAEVCGDISGLCVLLQGRVCTKTNLSILSHSLWTV